MDGDALYAAPRRRPGHTAPTTAWRCADDRQAGARRPRPSGSSPGSSGCSASRRRTATTRGTPERLEYRFAARRRDGGRREGATSPRSTPAGTAGLVRRSTSTATPPRSARDAESAAGCPRDDAHVIPAPVLRRHAEHAAGGRSRTAARTSATSTPTPPTWPSCCSSSSRSSTRNDWFLVPCTLPVGTVATRRAAWRSRTSSASASGSSRRARAPTTTGGAGACSRSASRARRRAGRHQPAAPADRAEGCRRAAARGGDVHARRDGEHGLGRSSGRVPLADGRAPAPGSEAAAETLAASTRLDGAAAGTAARSRRRRSATA